MKAPFLSACLFLTAVGGRVFPAHAQQSPQPVSVAPSVEGDQTRVRELVFSAANLISTGAGSTTAGTLTVPALASGCALSSAIPVKKATLVVRLDMGEVYNLGSSAGQSQVQVTIQGNSSVGGLTLPAPLAAPFLLKVDAAHPTQTVVADLTAFADLTNIVVTIGQRPSAPPQALRLVARLEQSLAVTVTPTSTAGTLVAPISGVLTYNKFEQVFSWTPACALIGKYQVQLLKVPFENPLTAADDVKDDVKKLWANRAVLLEKTLTPAEQLALQTGSTAPVALSTTLAEGPGTYRWRVRAIGSLPGGVANPANWSDWTASVGFALEEPATGPKLTDLNWIYSRTFSEGGRVSERISFANRLLHTRQVQTRLASTQQVLGLQTVQDYVGRDALQSLPFPLDRTTTTGTVTSPVGLGFKSGLLTAMDFSASTPVSLGAYAPKHFDRSSGLASTYTYNNPVKAVDPIGYYNGTSTAASAPANDGVASAEGVPFVRTLFSRDGTNRVREQSGAGPVLGLPAAGSTSHTVRTTYASVAQSELDYMFGAADAPQAVNTYKVVTQDPNNVTTVNYQTKAGQTIATALSGTSGAETLAPLPSAKNLQTISDVLDNKTNYADLGSVSTKLILVPASGLTYTYSITPQTIQDLTGCTAFCSTCDYHIEIKLKSIDDPDAAPICLGLYDVPFSTVCTGRTPLLDNQCTAPTIPAGTYALEKVVTTYNRATGATSTYLDSKLASLRAEYEAIKTTPVWNASTGISSFLDPTCPHVANLYTYLSTLPSSAATPHLTAGVVTSYSVRFGCDGTTIEIPVLDLNCGQSTVCIESKEYINYLKDQAPGFLESSIGTYFPGITSFDDLQQLFDNMQGQGSFSCTDMWNCWQATVAAYQANVEAGTRNQNLMRSYLSCLNAPISNYVSNSGDLNPSNAFYTGVFDENDQNQMDCLQALPSAYQASGGVFSPALSNQDYEQLMACSAGAGTATGPAGPSNVGTVITTIQSTCEKRCDERRQEFEAAILRDFRRQGIYTYLDKWTLKYQAGDDDKIRDLAKQVAELQDKIKKLQDGLTPGDLATWIKIQTLQAQATRLAARTPQTCAISNQVELLNAQINDLTQQMQGGSGVVDELTQALAAIAKLQSSLNELQPATYVTTIEAVNPDKLNELGIKVVEACEIAMMVDELVQECRGACRLDVPLDADGVPANTPPINPDAMAQLQNALTGVMEVTVRLVDAPDCQDGYTPTPVNPGLKRESAEVTKCAVDVISYMDALARKFASFPGFPSHGVSRPVLGPAANNIGLGELKPDDLSYVGPLSKDCNRIQDDCALHFTDRENYWVTVQDARCDINDYSNPYTNSNYALYNDFRILWLGYHINNLPYQADPAFPYLDLPTGEDVAGVPKLVSANCQVVGTLPSVTSPVSQLSDYLVRFENVVDTKKFLNKDHIVSISRPYVDDSGGRLPGYGDPFSTDNVFVDIMTTNQGRVKARIILDIVSPNLKDVSHFLKWKDVTGCEIQERHYATCYRWVQPVMPPAQGGYDPVPPTCEETVAEQLRNTIAQQQDAWIQSTVERYRQQYVTKCAAPASLVDNFSFSYKLGYHHFTLYYYDRAGNLVKTIPPKGFNITNPAAHKMATTYEYNSLKQLVKQTTPDGGVTDFIYNRVGQLRFSLNDKQASGAIATWSFSYTRYDELGRSIEVGENNSALRGTTTRAEYLQELQLRAETMAFPVSAASLTRTETVYSQAYGPTITYNGAGQQYLTNRVGYTQTYNGGSVVDPVRTHYSYDPHGNVEWLAQSIPGLTELKYTHYDYDLLSNKVLKVAYQAGQSDQFFHRYAYDDDNRLTSVFTSADGQLWDQDASYQYYAHGPLKRLELGQDKVQGIDYTYTLQGWLKAINHPNLDPSLDPGHDGQSSGAGADAFGMTLGYFNGDYVRSQSPFNANTAATPNTNLFEPGTASLYNGNIATWQLRNLRNVPTDPSATPRPRVDEKYRYDQLNRLLSTTQYDLNGGVGIGEALDDFATSYSYDANGNLLTLNRRKGSATVGGAAAFIDKLAYVYPESGQSNRLRNVTDEIQDNVSNEDIDNQPTQPTPPPAVPGQPSQLYPPDNYTYDALGNLTSDAQNNVTVEWTVSGKIARTRMYAAGHMNDPAYVTFETTYLYDAAGNRVRKSLSVSSGFRVDRTYYVRDAQGNILSVYTQVEEDGGIEPLLLVEQPIYGSSRLGERKPNMEVTAPSSTPTYVFTRTLGQKSYELDDHLGNVRAVVTDKKQAPVIAGQPTTTAFVPDLTAYYNYYAFGMMQPGNYGPGNNTGTGYRFGFNGKEKTDGVELGLTNYDYGARIYNPSLGRWLSLDPEMERYPSLSPYHSFANNPIFVVDQEGKSNIIYLLIARDSNGKPLMTKEKAELVAKKSTQYLSHMGLNTQVVFFDESERGQFNVSSIDVSDNVAVVGSSAKAVVSTMASKVSPSFAADVTARSSSTEGFLGNSADEPEEANLRSPNVNGSVGNRIGIVVRTDQAMTAFRTEVDGIDKIRHQFKLRIVATDVEAIALTIIHAAGHNTEEINGFSDYSGSYGHTNDGVMAPGQRLKVQMAAGGVGNVISQAQSDNKTYVRAMQSRYGKGKAQDNYDRNQRGKRPRTPAYQKK